MIDPLLSLSFNLHSQKGTYALLLGSGISRAAGIPTGWEVTLDLVSKLARLQNEECVGTENQWYKEKYGNEPDYSALLATLAPKAAAQQQLLKGYFEPSIDERSEGKKVPTAAHRAIAQLVASGHINVIVTTNFDRLLESALEAQGIAPVVIDSHTKVAGAPPLAHSKCTVIKVHGDYLDHRIKNSPDALASYKPEMNKLLNRVFDDYGLIICGWSGEYDTALRVALERVKSRRYPLYWAGRNEPKGAARGLINLHGALFVKIQGADDFFSSLCEKVHTLDEFNRSHPLSVAEAVASLKRYLGESKYRIPLHDMLNREALDATAAVNVAFEVTKTINPDQESYTRLLKQFDAACEKLMNIFANGGYHGDQTVSSSFFHAYDLLVCSIRLPGGGITIWIDSKRYPAVLLAYAAGIAAFASGNFDVFSAIANGESYLQDDEHKAASAPVRIYPYRILSSDDGRILLDGQKNKHTPLNNHLFRVLRDPLRNLIPDDIRYETAFDSFEYLWCLLHVDAMLQKRSSEVWTPTGRFCWRRLGKSERWLKDDLKDEIEKMGTPKFLQAGLFGGSFERLERAFEYSVEPLNEISKFMRFRLG